MLINVVALPLANHKDTPFTLQALCGCNDAIPQGSRRVQRLKVSAPVANGLDLLLCTPCDLSWLSWPSSIRWTPCACA